MEILINKVLPFLPWVQIVLSVILITSVLLQQTGIGVGGAMGGGDDSIHYTRRGMEKVLFYVTIVVAILFAFSALAVILANK
ncbi:MAG: preprotein translocase subunit SecG [Candidatus Pacebacteria bacterium]|nr:preprotein translocase subunit SecG [Candidatus Paceibacterota bacterium]